MKKTFLWLFVAISLNSYSQSALDLNEKIPVSEDVKIGTLENGLTYYIQNNKKPENKVELRLVVNAGSILEKESQRGLAHFMEHMNFNGTKNFKHNELVDYLQSIGVKFGQHLNAYTSFDETVYILPIPSEDPEKVEKGFDILEDWAFNCLLTPEEIEKERGVVLEELRLGLGAEKRMMDKYLPMLMYGSQYAERLPIGLKSVLENFKHEELEDFYTTWYRPNLMAVLVVGDVDVDEMEQKVKDHFGPYKNPKKPEERKDYFVPDHEQTFVAIESDPEASFTRTQLVYKDHGNAKPIETIGDYRDNLVTRLFNTMLNSRLDEIANNPNPPFTYAYSYHGSGWSRNKESYQSLAMSSPENQLKAFEILVEENERVYRHGFIEPEFDRAKKEMMAQMESILKNKDKQESRRIVSEYVRNFLTDEYIPGIEWEYEKGKALLEGISVDEVNQLIKTYIHDDNRVAIFTGPSNTEASEITEAQVLSILSDVKTKDVTPYTEAAVAAALMTERPNAGTIVGRSEMAELGITKLELSNGVKVYYKKTDFKDNEILMQAYSPGGSSVIKDNGIYKNVMLAMGGMSETGVNGLTKNDMSKVMAGKKVRVNGFVSTNYEGMRGSTVNEDVEEMFQLIYLNFTSVNKDKDAYQSFVDKQSAFMGNLMNTPQYWYMNEKAKYVNQNNPRFSFGLPSAEDYASQDYDKAYKLYMERFADASDFSFIFIGSLDPTEIEKMSEQYLAALPSINRDESFVDHSYKHMEGYSEKTFNKGTDPKSTVDISYRTEAEYNAKHAYYLKSAGEILTIKLVENLREGESGVYGVGARGNVSKYPSGVYNFSISFPCGPDNAQMLKDAALEEVNNLVNEGPTAEDVEKVKEAQRLELKEDMKTNRFWLSTLNKMLYHDVEFSEMLNMPEEIEGLTAAKIHEAAKLYISDTRMITMLMPEE